MIIEFNLELEPECGFFALYAGLRMYQEQKSKATPKGQFSIAGAEAYCMREQLKEKFPKEYQEAEEEYNSVYADSSNLKIG